MELIAGDEKAMVLERARRYIAKCPPAISHQLGHNATFRVAVVLVQGFALEAVDALVLLRKWNQTCQPPWSEAELNYKVNSALHTPSNKPRGYLLTSERSEAKPGLGVDASAPKRPAKQVRRQNQVAFQPELLKRVAAEATQVDVTFIKERSPLSPETQTAVTFLQQLYQPGEQVLVFDRVKSQGRDLYRCVPPPFDARVLNHLRHGCADGVWFLGNPVDGKYHPNPRQGGKRSRRSEESITTWRYLVLESDEADREQWLAILAQVPLRIAAIYTSGRRSIHALVRVEAKSKVDWDTKAARLKPIMTLLGADPRNITGVRLTRLPCCHRGQNGPPAPAQPLVYPRWVDEPLEYDELGDPIWMPRERPPMEPPAQLWTGGLLQELLYLNPEPDTTPIQYRPTRQQIHQEWLAKVNGGHE